ncbi:hypothetical protein QYE76_060585 [Lolium multiflorum]|uniref:Transposase (putative) gypsy type domain-containing protein n=1 Tax=Lolium multiflorum TaxID=4521 RepID=A0AAD8S1J9_LOLMU|nr:hypothetical protein QYE76_060585 [Lolium multiflorum]
MGKKKSTSASDATKVSRDWSASAISNRDVNKLRALGFISASDDDIRLPVSPLPSFFYGIQLWQLTPNSILHLSIFITVCEAFLGIDPHWGLWRKIFYVKRHNDSNAPPVVGGVGFVVRKEVDYFDYPMKESIQGWHNKWFYLRDPLVPGRRSNLPPFEDVLVAHPKKSWRNALSPEERVIADRLFDQVVILKNTGGLTMCGTEASTVAQCYPPTPESGVEPEDDDDDSEETEDVQQALEDSDVQEDDTAEDAAFTRSKRRPPGFFAADDDLDLSDDDNVPLAKRAKLSFEKTASAKEPNPSPAKSTPPTRTAVEKIPVSKVIPPGNVPTSSAARDRPIYAIVDAVVDFAEQFTRLEAENAQLRKTVKTSADQVLEANRLATDAKNENVLLKEELKKLKRQMKDEQDARREAAVATDKKEGVLRESIKDLLEVADITITRAHQLREGSTSDALSLAAESNVQVLGLLQKTKGALSRLYSMIFPKMKQDKTLGEMADAFLVDSSEPVELLMGYGMGSNLEKLSKALPVDDDNHLVDLEPFKRSAVTCANQLLKLVDEAHAKPIPEAAPGSSSTLP